MIGVRQLIEHFSARRLRQRASQIASLMTDPHATVYPRELDFGRSPRRITVLTPHADDETFGVGGTLLRHIRHGDEVRVLLLSDNVASIDGARIGSERKRELRQEEFDRAMETLGITRHAVFGLGAGEFVEDKFPESVFFTLIENEPDVLYLPSVFDNHHDHRILNTWLLRTLRERTDFRPLIRGFEVWSPLPATAVADITEHMDRKREAMRCYASQQDAIDYTHHITGLNAYRAMTLGGRRARYAEAFLELPAVAYLELGNSCLK
jgi:LmbE family N-acetylglucosaminyl deacetylase